MTTQAPGGLHENTANPLIAEWLNRAGRQWQASAERTGRLLNSGGRPDIVITQGDRMPVIIECEFDQPAVKDAASRLGHTLQGETRPFTEIIAVGIDGGRRRDSEAEFRRRLEANERIFTIQLVSQPPPPEDKGGKGGGENKDSDDNKVPPKIWPNRPLAATPQDLAAYAEYAQVPQAVIARETVKIANAVKAAGETLLSSIRQTQGRAEPTLAKLRALTGSQHDHEKTPLRTPPEERPDLLRPVCPWVCGCNRQAAHNAGAIWLVAIDLQNDLAQFNRELQGRGLQTTAEVQRAATAGQLTPANLLEQWRIILEVNYLPVIELAIDSLEAGPLGAAAGDGLATLNELGQQMNGLHAKHIYNFAGELWQRLVADREERAAHYTKPEIAELLAQAAASRFARRPAGQIAALKLLDAACGTGTLIGAGERALRRLYAAQGGRDPNGLHRQRMEEHIYAMDVNGIAGTLTAKRLTDLNVEQNYQRSKVAVITDPAGSLILLDPGITGVSNVLGYRSVTPTKGIGGEEGVFHVMLQGIDWALMNPPYSRPMPGRGMATTGLSKPRAAARRHKYLMSNGQASLATDFGNLSNIRLAPNGVFSSVLPLTAARAGSWKPYRAELEKDFEDIVVIANVSSTELQSMSADTNMGELLIIATKRNNRPDVWRPTNILCVNLGKAPQTLAEGYALAQEIARIPADNQSGMITHGSYTRISQTSAGNPWNAVGDSNSELTEITTALLQGQAYDPMRIATHNLALPTITLGEIAETGPSDDLLGHNKDAKDPRGAFEWTPLGELDTLPAHQSMWAAIAETQTTLVTKPTHGGRIVRNGLAQRMVELRSRWFFKRNMRWTSQATAAAHALDDTHGGAAWTALCGVSDEVGKAITLYYNSIFGGIARSSYGANQKQGRSEIRIMATANTPCPAFHEDTPAARQALDIAARHFDELAQLPLLPFAYCFQDGHRRRIDGVVAEMLGLDAAEAAVQQMLAYWRTLFAGEPNVNGRQRKIVDALERHRAGGG